MNSLPALTARFLVPLAAFACGCSSLPQEYQPVIDSLHTPEMEAAIKAAREPSTPRS
ncbi:MAG TPA: hypothetical protein VM051_12660 [Usitatibacter sp.]|nr:hypothetical protein [Usitatibacter sp.]